ncbi:uncharacterized protein A1O9_00926 [Exophiala aquamarina CBS 119918]|uniref:DUF3835 domain-containing protein n=1 Tax=Exophiala aquamarina CBS 119918 TaxID=1182545 RepID=A0A072PSU4_9EURO|nr:uncharacterized protein A1O9_00926 [Exophiala aquamarina CBS 119918]KEF62951.1 hypothetical protein A1O9_00926 [Exophiala aquamarina CBS 119918]
MDATALARVERQRLGLESSITKLRESLRHWQTLEIDYEGLKEEFMGLSEDSSMGECLQAGLDFKAELVDEKELKSLLRVNTPPTRRPSQLVDLLSNRIDYVSKNVETVRKQLSDAEKKRNALLLAEEPEHRDDAGLPLAEITEELDESGNVISSKVQNPGTDAPQLIDVLKKVGINDLKETNGTITKTNVSAGNHRVESNLTKQQDPQNDLGTVSQTDAKMRSDDTEEEALLRQEMLDYRNGLDEVGAIVAELDLEEGASDFSYDEDDDNFDVESDFDDDEDDDESEDEAGKSKQRLRLSRTYKQQMEDLQAKLGVKNIGAEVEPKHDCGQDTTSNRPSAAEAARRAAIARQTGAAKSSLKPHAREGGHVSKEKPKKKSVAFSSELHIAPGNSNNENPSSGQTANSSIQKPYVRPVVESVIERTVPSSEDDAITAGAPPSATPKKSLSKSSRESRSRKPISKDSANSSTEPEKEAELSSTRPISLSTIISRDLVERPASKTTAAPDPNDFSDASHQREITMEYQRMRMKRIHAQQGGFTGDGEDDNYGEAITPMREKDEQTGKEKKVSRFKAARLNR